MIKFFSGIAAEQAAKFIPLFQQIMNALVLQHQPSQESLWPPNHSNPSAPYPKSIS
jgi:hypothetical protein